MWCLFFILIYYLVFKLWIDDVQSPKKNVKTSTYEEALDALSSLITKRSRADKSNKGDRFDLLFDYVKVNTNKWDWKPIFCIFFLLYGWLKCSY